MGKHSEDTGGYGYVPPRPHRAVQRRAMNPVEHLFHLLMCCCTMGVWLPVYLGRIRARKTVTTYE